MLSQQTNNLYDFVSEIEKFLQDSNTGYAKIGSIDLVDLDREIIKDCIDLRKKINDIRDVNKLVKYQRTNGDEVDLKGFSGEYMFSRFMYQLHANGRRVQIEVILPAVAEMILNKTKQDVDITDLRVNKKFTFDLKSQFINNSWPFLSINQKSFQRMKEQSEFFIFCSVHCTDPKDIKTFSKVDFYTVKNEFFAKNSFNVDQHWKANFTPYHKLPLSYFDQLVVKPEVSEQQKTLDVLLANVVGSVK